MMIADQGSWKKWTIGLAAAATFGWLIVFFGGGYSPDLHRAADLGTALGPLATLATAAALIIGFRSLEIQREELSLQRAELKLQREQMAASTEELARTAKAQQELSRAQNEAAAALREANGVAELARQAQISLVQAQMKANELQRFANQRSLQLVHAQLIQAVTFIDAALAQAEAIKGASAAMVTFENVTARSALAESRKQLAAELEGIRGRLQFDEDAP